MTNFERSLAKITDFSSTVNPFQCNCVETQGVEWVLLGASFKPMYFMLILKSSSLCESNAAWNSHVNIKLSIRQRLLLVFEAKTWITCKQMLLDLVVHLICIRDSSMITPTRESWVCIKLHPCLGSENIKIVLIVSLNGAGAVACKQLRLSVTPPCNQCSY